MIATNTPIINTKYVLRHTSHMLCLLIKYNSKQTMQIDPTNFLPVNTLKDMFKLLSPYGESRLVGGCVREMLLNKPVKDIDIATQVESNQLIDILSEEDYKCIPTGLKHGTVTVIKDGHKFEITTLRLDTKTFGRHAEVEYTKNWQLDASRRDFTINALYMDIEGNIYDYYNGTQDLKSLKLQFIGDAKDRIKEDYLRILRYFRFYSFLGGNDTDKIALLACSELAKGIDSLSGERCRQELLKLLSYENVAESLTLMQHYNILKYLIPIKFNINFNLLKFCNNPIINLTVIFKLSGLTKSQLIPVMKRLSLTNSEKLIINALLYEINLNSSSTRIEHKEVIYYHGVILYEYSINLFTVLNPTIPIIDLKNLILPDFPLNGEDFKAIGLNGKEIGDRIRSLEKLWINSDFKLNKSQLLEHCNV